MGRDCDLAASLLSRNPAIAETLITHRLPLEGAACAYAMAADRKGSGAIKVILEPTHGG